MIYENCDYLADTWRGQARISRIFDLHFGKVVKTALKVRKNDTFQNVQGMCLDKCVTLFEWSLKLWSNCTGHGGSKRRCASRRVSH